MAYHDKSAKAVAEREARIFKVLDYDPELSLSAIQTRFAISHAVAHGIRQEWRKRNANKN